MVGEVGEANNEAKPCASMRVRASPGGLRWGPGPQAPIHPSHESTKIQGGEVEREHNVL